MAFKFNDAFNKFVESNNKLNKKVNEVIGKDVFKEAKKIEEPKTFSPYSSFPEYNEPEPEQWYSMQGVEKEFELNGSRITIPSELDTCIQYKSLFKTSAEYYTNRFKFKYQNCVNDYDSFVFYFSDMYLDGLSLMLKRAYSLLLPFGVFNIDIDTFTSNHIDNYKKAIKSYETLAGVETAQNEAAKNAGNIVGNSVQMSGGGFGFKGAMKGMAQAEAFNIGMGLLGKFVEHQNKMSQEEKAEVFSKFNQELFFEEVYNDYFNTYFTLIKTLVNNRIISGVETTTDKEFETMAMNLQNPMFPADKFTPALATFIQKYPFESICYELAKQKFGETDEVKELTNYFLG